MWTKAELIEQAFTELALAGYAFEKSPEELADGLRRLDTMMATWDHRGIHVGYAGSSTPSESDSSADSGLPDFAVEAVYTNLAVRLAASKGKTLSTQTLALAKDLYDNLLLDETKVQQQQLPSRLPRGQGNRPWRSTPYMPAPDTSPLGIDEGGDLEFLEP